MNRKVLIGSGGTLGVVGVILAVLWTILSGGGIKLAYTYDYAGDEAALIATLQGYPDDTIVGIKCIADNVTIHNSPEISLQGEADFDGLAGDMLYLNKLDGKWIEMTGRVFVDR